MKIEQLQQRRPSVADCVTGPDRASGQWLVVVASELHQWIQRLMTLTDEPVARRTCRPVAQTSAITRCPCIAAL